MMRKWSTPVILIALLALLVIGGVWGWRSLTSDPTTSRPCVTMTTDTLNSSQVQVRVLNAGTTTGLANSVASELTDVGFVVASTGNTSTSVSGTTIIGADTDDPEVQLVSGFFPGAQLQGDERSDHMVDVIVTNDFGDDSFTNQASTTIDVASGQVCLPSMSSSASAGS